MSPLVSILVPAYNAEQWVGAAIKSALAQTWSRKEIIVVDDGSSDGTLAVARQFASDGVQVLSQSNQGAAAARNLALSASQGEYIQWLDSDDLIAPDKIERQLQRVEFASSTRLLLSSSWGSFFYRISKARSTPTPLWTDLDPVEWILHKMRHNAWMAIESWLISRTLAEGAGPWDTTLTADDDGEYFSRVICGCDGIAFVPEAKSYVREANLGSMSRSIVSKRQLESQFRSISLQISQVMQLEDGPRVREAALAFLQTWFGHFYPEQKEIMARVAQLARELGGQVDPPSLNWKYVAFQRCLGWKAAKKAAFVAPRTKARCIRHWDKLVFAMSSHE